MVFSAALLGVIIPKGVPVCDGSTATGLSPAFMPRVLAGILGFFACLLVLKRPLEQAEPLSSLKLFPARTFLTILLFVLYIAAVPLVGYLAATLVFLPAALFFFGARNWAVIIPLSIGLPLLLYWFFSRIMFVLLPCGAFS